MRISTLIGIVLILSSCSMKKADQTEQYKNEIVAAEKAFAKLVKEKGIKEGFLSFAADSAVVRRGEELHIGKEALNLLYSRPSKLKDVVLEWTPDFVDVAASGDLGYTYGKYYFSGTDSLGNTIEERGIFHTVWKRQQDGSWKFVWD